MTIAFSESGLVPELEQSVTDLGFIEPTPIQMEIIPLMLEGHDVIGQAQTGTGKTAAFMLPIIQSLEPGRHGVQALVLAPTRELALQVANAAEEFGRYLNLRVLAVYGGQPYYQQIRSLQRGVDIVVGTPGRLLDLLDKGELDLSTVRTLVLDEADEMLSMGFIEDIETILSCCPEDRQTALFSATMPREISDMAVKYMHSPKFVSIKSRHLTVDAIDHRYLLVNKGDKLSVLTRIFEVEDISRALIFVRTRVGTGDLVNELMGRGVAAEALNGDLNQMTREQVLNRFRNNQITVLVATDMAARGLDIDDISHVFNYDLPEDPELYVHRVGRTGRAGKSGIAISLVTTKETWRLHRIEGFTKQTITRMPIPTVEQIEEVRENKLLEQMALWLKRGRYQKEMLVVNKLLEMDFDPLQVAAAALKVARKEEKQRPIGTIGVVKEDRPQKGTRRPSESGNRRPMRRESGGMEKGMTRLKLSAGKIQGLRPADIVASLAYQGGFPGNTIGAILIEDRHTLVDIPQQFVQQVMDKAGSYRVRRCKVELELA